MTIAGAVLWVLRARFFLLDVRRFGTAIVQFLKVVDKPERSSIA
jgi:hypothetical protein